jgi:hypothetical protein
MISSDLGTSPSAFAYGEGLQQFLKERLAEREMARSERMADLQEEEQKREAAINEMKRSMISQAIQQQMGGWQRGGQPADVGGFSQGGAPMQPTVAGPGGPTPFAQSSAQYQPPQQAGGMSGEMVRGAMGLKGEDPQQKFQKQVMLEGIKNVFAGERQQAGIQKREDLIRERLQKTEKQHSQAQVMGSILQYRLEHPEGLPPEMQAAWDMVHPIDKNVMELAEKRLKENVNYVGASPQVQERMRAEEINKIYAAFGRSKEVDVPEPEEESEDLSPGEMGQLQRFMYVLFNKQYKREKK